MSECCICHKELSRKDVEYYFWSGADKYELCKTCKGVIDQSKLNDDAYNLLMKALSRLPDDQSRRIKIQFNILDEETRMSSGELRAEVMANYLWHEHLSDCTVLSENARYQQTDDTLPEEGVIIQ